MNKFTLNIITNKLIKIIMSVVVAVFIVSLIPGNSVAGPWNGWVYQNPYPTANTLLAVQFITPKKGWMTGEHGTILHTEDGGDSWEAQKSWTEEDIKSLSFINEKTGWAVGKRGVITHTEDGGKTWVSQENITSTLNCVFSITDKEAWAVGENGTVLHTLDGGIKWNSLTVGITRAVARVYFINSQTGWLLAGEAVYRTKDGGKNWEVSLLQVNLPEPGAFGGKSRANAIGNVLPNDWWEEDFVFLDDKNGWLVLGTWQIFHTTDGGKSWEAKEVGYRSYGLSRISFIDAQHGCAGGTSIICTEDGGETWQERLGIKPGEMERRDGFMILIRGISLTTPSLGWVVGVEGEILKTEDGGKNWAVKSRSRNLSDYFWDSSIGWTRSYRDYGRHKIKGSLVKTENSGLTWTAQKEFDAAVDIHYFFLNSSSGWVVGQEWDHTDYGPDIHYSFIFHTTDGGKTWLLQFKKTGGERGISNDLQDIYFINSDTGWVVGANGLVLHTEDGGKNWNKQNSGTKFKLREVQFIDAQRGWIIGHNMTENGAAAIILHTNDSGKHWFVQWKKETEWMGLTNLSFVNEKIGWVIGPINEYSGDAIFLHTTNGGKTWSEKVLSKIDYDKMYFHDKDKGAILTEKGTVLITNDGGTTWTKELQFVRRYPWHISELFRGNN